MVPMIWPIYSERVPKLSTVRADSCTWAEILSMPRTVCWTISAPSLAVLVATSALLAACRQFSAMFLEVAAISSLALAMVSDWRATDLEPVAICRALPLSMCAESPSCCEFCVSWPMMACSFSTNRLKVLERVRELVGQLLECSPQFGRLAAEVGGLVLLLHFARRHFGIEGLGTSGVAAKLAYRGPDRGLIFLRQGSDAGDFIERGDGVVALCLGRAQQIGIAEDHRVLIGLGLLFEGIERYLALLRSGKQGRRDVGELCLRQLPGADHEKHGEGIAENDHGHTEIDFFCNAHCSPHGSLSCLIILNRRQARPVADCVLSKVVGHFGREQRPVLHHAGWSEVEPGEGSALQGMTFEFHHHVAHGIEAQSDCGGFLIHVEVVGHAVGGVIAAVTMIAVLVILVVVGAEFHPISETVGRADVPGIAPSLFDGSAETPIEVEVF